MLDQKTTFTATELKAIANIEAIELLNEHQSSDLNPSQIDIIKRYTGWGGLASIFSDSNSKPIADRLKHAVGDQAYKALRESILSSYFTPQPVASAMWQILSALGFSGGRIIEPAAGSGSLITACPESISSQSNFVAIESCPTTADVLSANHPNVKVIKNGYQATALKYDYYDLAILNPPYIETFISDDFDRKLKGSEHNFFMQKAVLNVREGAFVCALVTRNFMDAVDSTSREAISKHARLVASYRLPSSVFANDNTNIITDLVIFQRVPRGDAFGRWVYSTCFANTENGKVNLNNYYHDNPQNVLGVLSTGTDRFNKAVIQVTDSYESLSKLLSDCASKLTSCYIENAPVSISKGHSDAVVTEDIALFQLGFDDEGDVVKRLMDCEGDRQYEPVSLNKTQCKRLGAMVEIRNHLLSLLALENSTATDDECQIIRNTLNHLYDAFVSRYGAISNRANRFMRQCSSFGALLGLEHDFTQGLTKAAAEKAGVPQTDDTWNKSTIFSKRVNFPSQANNVKADNPHDALIASLKYNGGVDMAYMSTISGLTHQQLTQGLVGAIFFDPALQNYQYKDIYLSGNVIEKIKLCEAHLSNRPELAGNIQALEEIAPVKLRASDIHVAFGAPWLPESVMSDFLTFLLKPKKNVQFTCAYVGGKWIISLDNYQVDHTFNQTTYGTDRNTALEIIHKLLNHTSLKVFDTNNNNKRILNLTDTQRLQDAAERIKQEFTDWLYLDSDRAELIADTYNRNFNCFVEPVIDGSVLTDDNGLLHGQNPNLPLREHQLNAIMRGVLCKSQLVDVAVGGGKTAIGLFSIMIQKKLGLIQKGMCVVPNHLVATWVSEIKKFYPAANVLVGDEHAVCKENREQFLANITFGNWDIIVVAKSTFYLIPCSDDYTTEFVTDYIDEVEARMESTEDRASLRELEKVKRGLNAKLLNVMNRQSRDKTNFPFESLGVSCLVVDEIHEKYKNLLYISKLTNVGGMGASDGSQSALDLFMKVRYLQKNNGGRGIIGLSGTTITNSPIEAYTLLRYFAYDEMQAAGLTDADTFISIFSEPESRFELSASGQYKERTRLRRFTNLPELAQLFRQFAYVITKEDLKANCKAAGQPWYEPEMTNGKPTLIACERSSDQADYMDSLIHRAENLRNVDPSVDNMLKICSDAGKATLDMRLIDPELPKNPNGKIPITARLAARTYANTHDVKGVIIVFIDLGTPNGKKLNLYQELKDDMVSLGVLESDISFIHDANSIERKKHLSQQLNEGDKRILIASTAKGATGLNIQKRICAIINTDLSLSWHPAHYTQRLGRGFRSGSLLLELSRQQGEPDHTIDVYNLATDQSLDSFRFGLLETKARFISQMKTAQLENRIVNDDDETEDSTDSFAAIKAVISGNPLILANVQTERKIKQLLLKRKAHNTDVLNAQQYIAQHANHKDKYAETLECALRDIATANQFENQYVFTLGNETHYANTDEELETLHAILKAQHNETLANLKQHYKDKKAERSEIVSLHGDAHASVRALDIDLSALSQQYKTLASQHIRRPRCAVVRAVEKEFMRALNTHSTSLYGAKVELGKYRGFTLSISLDFRKQCLHIQGEVFKRTVRFSASKNPSVKHLIKAVDDVYDEVFGSENAIHNHYQQIDSSYRVYEQRQHAQFEHEDALIELGELQREIEKSLSSKTEISDQYKHLIPELNIEKTKPVRADDIVLPERIMPLTAMLKVLLRLRLLLARPLAPLQMMHC
jgi:N12 class adenine-specific DNA methylase/predicted RNA methylase